MQTIPLCSTNLAQDSALLRLRSIGFSQKTGLPTSEHFSIKSAWVAVLLAIM